LMGAVVHPFLNRSKQLADFAACPWAFLRNWK
jgi:hypothetical protein